MVAPWKTVCAVVLVLIGAGSAWLSRDWRYGKQLAEQARLHAETLNQLTMAATTAQQAEQDKRLALKKRLAASDKTHSEKMTNARKAQALLRERLATSDLRLSVLIDAGSAGGCSVSATVVTGGVDHAAVRAQLDPAHAQRIVATTGEGDRGLIALQACQAYIRALAPAHFE
ncbi:UNVERIFIED_ORG: hypothetical protein J2X80_000896 [Pseudomonas fluorescens]|nr:hypothetical protein [Pseudomonas fluorescens]